MTRGKLPARYRPHFRLLSENCFRLSLAAYPCIHMYLITDVSIEDKQHEIHVHLLNGDVKRYGFYLVSKCRADCNRLRKSEAHVTWHKQWGVDGEIPIFPNSFLSISPSKLRSHWDLSTNDLQVWAGIRTASCQLDVDSDEFSRESSLSISNRMWCIEGGWLSAGRELTPFLPRFLVTELSWDLGSRVRQFYQDVKCVPNTITLNPTLPNSEVNLCLQFSYPQYHGLWLCDHHWMPNSSRSNPEQPLFRT